MTVYALHHPDGRWLYHLPKLAGRDWQAKTTGMLADGQPMGALPADWWSAPAEASRLTAVVQPAPKTVSYKLRDIATESVRYPATLTVTEFNDRDDDHDTLWELYTSVTEDQPPVEHVFEGPIVVLEGREPPQPGEPQWVADLPHFLTQRPEYRHLFPGHIPGLVVHMMRAFEAMPRVKHVFLNFQNRPGIYVDVSVPYDEPRTEFRHDTSWRTGKKLKSGRTVPVTVSRTVTLPIPDRVPGATYEEALSSWHEQAAYWTGVVEEISVAACHHCDGNGYVPQGSEKYSNN
ncbi:hypothetical protein [Streptomyces sp. NPDC008150]|uniref:hypothetical protein n=1 Tax=Streptomyces sp. NPDC008150 TaxID=3364816 RepID=UPI0036E1E309